MCVLIRGKVEILKKADPQSQNPPKRLVQLEGGSVFGELAALGVAHVRSTSVVSLGGDCRLVKVARTQLWETLSVFRAEREKCMDLALQNLTGMPTMSVSRVPIFSSFPPSCLELLNKVVRRRIVRPGETVVHEGQDRDVSSYVTDVRGTSVGLLHLFSDVDVRTANLLPTCPNNRSLTYELPASRGHKP